MDIDSGTWFCHEIESFMHEFQPVPIPAAVWLFGSGLGLLGFMGRRRRQA